MPAEPLSRLLRHDRAVVLAGLTVVIAAAWAYLLLGAGIETSAADMVGGRIMAMRPEWTLGYAALIYLMWAVMMAAMMLPGAAPTLLLVAALTRRWTAGHATAPTAAGLFGLGYLAVWWAFSVAATLLQWGLDTAGWLSDTMAVANAVVAGIMLVAAGAYQWTPFKDTCLRHCRAPAEFLVRHWRQGALGAVATGARHGLYCLGCCGMLMALLFVAGLMNLAWVAAVAILVLVEKTMPWGGRMGRLTGTLLAIWGAIGLARIF